MVTGMSNHLEEQNISYFRHWIFAFQFGLLMIVVGFCVLIHAFIPALFKDTGSDAIRAMSEVLSEEEE